VPEPRILMAASRARLSSVDVGAELGAPWHTQMMGFRQALTAGKVSAVGQPVDEKPRLATQNWSCWQCPVATLGSECRVGTVARHCCIDVPGRLLVRSTADITILRSLPYLSVAKDRTGMADLAPPTTGESADCQSTLQRMKFDPIHCGQARNSRTLILDPATRRRGKGNADDTFFQRLLVVANTWFLNTRAGGAAAGGPALQCICNECFCL